MAFSSAIKTTLAWRPVLQAANFRLRFRWISRLVKGLIVVNVSLLSVFIFAMKRWQRWYAIVDLWICDLWSGVSHIPHKWTWATKRLFHGQLRHRNPSTGVQVQNGRPVDQLTIDTITPWCGTALFCAERFVIFFFEIKLLFAYMLKKNENQYTVRINYIFDASQLANFIKKVKANKRRRMSVNSSSLFLSKLIGLN